MNPQKLNAIVLTVVGVSLMLGGQWALAPGHAAVPPLLDAVVAMMPLVGFILLALGLYRLYKASR
jgi:hypothetical protein